MGDGIWDEYPRGIEGIRALVGERVRNLFPGWRVTLNFKDEYMNQSVHVYIHKTPVDYNYVAYFTLSGFPLNNQIMLSLNTLVVSAHRGQGIATRLQILKKDIAASVGIKYLMATVNNGNDAEIRTLERSGWAPMQNLGVSTLWLYDMSKHNQTGVSTYTEVY